SLPGARPNRDNESPDLSWQPPLPFVLSLNDPNLQEGARFQHALGESKALALDLPRFRGRVVSCVRRHRLTLKLHRGMVAECRVPPACVIEALNAVDDGPARRVVSLERGAVDQLALERGEEALTHGVVVAVADRSHRRP